MDILRQELDPDQMTLASELSSNLLVLAGPGSGKTRVITHRVAYLFRTNVIIPPQMVLGITFTNKAAAEMRGRVRQISSIASKWSHIMTFHKFGEQFLRNYGYLRDLRRDFVIYDESLQAIAIRTAASQISLKNVNTLETVNSIDKLKSEHGSTEAAVRELMNQDNKTLAKLILVYDQVLRSNNAVDFSDLLCLPLEILKEYPQLVRVIQDIYSHVLVDECQDTNHVQLKLLKEMFGDSSAIVFGVADEDQSIYKWRGARIRNLRDFMDIFHAEPRSLKRNYRCHASILRVADSLILNASGRLKEGESIACRPDDGECRAHRVDVRDLEAEGSFVANSVIELKREGKISKWQDVCVLGRNWGHLKATADALNEAEIPNIVLNEADIPDTPEVNVVLSALRSCASPDDELARQLVREYLSEVQHPDPEIFNPNVLVTPSSFIGLPNTIRKYLGLDQLLDVLEDEEKERRLEAMNTFQGYCAKVASIARDLSSFSRMLTLEGHNDPGAAEEIEDAVNLMSIHTSKGTERKVVYIMALDKEIFPRFNIQPDSDEWEEERRLLYVSITRAEDYVYLVHCQNRPTVSGSFRYREPSPLLLEIDQNLLSFLEYE